jgi:hypothetical protein
MNNYYKGKKPLTISHLSSIWYQSYLMAGRGVDKKGQGQTPVVSGYYQYHITSAWNTKIARNMDMIRDMRC